MGANEKVGVGLEIGEHTEEGYRVVSVVDGGAAAACVIGGGGGEWRGGKREVARRGQRVIEAGDVIVGVCIYMIDVSVHGRCAYLDVSAHDRCMYLRDCGGGGNLSVCA